MAEALALSSDPTKMSPVPPKAYGSFMDLMSIDNLSFEGGGPAGSLYATALERLEHHGIRPGVKRTLGTSAGAIVAAIIAMGANSTTLKKTLTDTNLEDLLDDECVLKSFTDVLRHYGVNDGDELEARLEDIIAELGFDKKLTLEQLHAFREQQIQETGHSSLCDLYIVMCDLNRQPSRQIAHFSDPFYKDVPIAKLLHASCSIPAMFEPVEIKGHLHVDGGVVDKNPLRYFDRAKFRNDLLNADLDPETVIFNPHSLGFRLFNPEDLEARLNPETGLELSKIDGFKKMFLRLLNATAEGQESNFEQDALRTIYCHRAGVDGTQFSITEEQKACLERNGAWAVDLFILENQKRVFKKSEPTNIHDYIIAFLERSKQALPDFQLRTLGPDSIELTQGVGFSANSPKKLRLVSKKKKPMPVASEVTLPSDTTEPSQASTIHWGAAILSLITFPLLALQFGFTLLSAAIIGLVAATIIGILTWKIASMFNKAHIQNSQLPEDSKTLPLSNDEVIQNFLPSAATLLLSGGPNIEKNALNVIETNAGLPYEHPRLS